MILWSHNIQLVPFICWNFNNSLKLTKLGNNLPRYVHVTYDMVDCDWINIEIFLCRVGLSSNVRNNKICRRKSQPNTSTHHYFLYLGLREMLSLDLTLNDEIRNTQVGGICHRFPTINSTKVESVFAMIVNCRVVFSSSNHYILKPTLDICWTKFVPCFSQ